ncbi:adenosylmethionine decarboxylase [Pseudonocardia sp. H11422]|uniref:adenosylmethionine decarboxylase n=1 Tax=Pseudonocardia sp. H11422 TaxID=2835866 RepID=UPI001BDD713F|nr:adenosylmethionine decarboxylase [Pseudonocardia sp. H11422]
MPDPTLVPPAPFAPQPVGRHVLAELAVADAAVLDDTAALRGALHDALVGAGAQVRQIVAEAFAPQGATVVALLAESHASVHTWPEHATAHVDVFTCGDAADPELAVRLFAAALGASVRRLDVIERGGPPATVTEPISPGLTRRWTLGAVHHRATTPYQRVLIADTAHGVTLFCDDERQSAEATQLVYHEALFVPAALLAARCERVLVIGSSEGVVSDLAVAAGAAQVDHVDIDADCVRACAEYLPYGYTPDQLAAAERHEGPVRVHYEDGRAFVEHTPDRWDVIVLDLPDERPDEPEAQLNRLYAADFLARCAQRLTDGGVVVCQAGSPALWRDATLRAAWRRFDDVFGPGGVVYAGSDEHEWAFLIGCPAAPADPVAAMAARLAALPVPPASIDTAWLGARTVPPATLRRGSASAARHDDAGDGHHGRNATSTTSR